MGKRYRAFHLLAPIPVSFVKAGCLRILPGRRADSLESAGFHPLERRYVGRFHADDAGAVVLDYEDRSRQEHPFRVKAGGVSWLDRNN